MPSSRAAPLLHTYIAAVLSLAAAVSVHPGADRHRRLQDSIQECRDGHDGVIVELLPSALPSEQVVECGRKGWCHLQSITESSPTAKHEVRCCSDVRIDGWARHSATCPYTASDGPEIGGCHHEKTYEQAEAICSAAGARLCTKEELETDCAAGTGCGHDWDLIWSSSVEASSASTNGQRCVSALRAKAEAVGAEIMYELPSNEAIAVHASGTAVDELLADEEIQSVTANCMIVLPDSEMQRARSISDALSWGIDRIDSRSGRDGQYDDSGATGSGSLVYILDTGVRISHDDFGGRAVAGWSAGCPTDPSACGSNWVYEGVITDANTCNGHGTHCASTAGGSTYGVAEDTTIVTVQVLSCAGSGSTAGVIAGIEWAVADSKTRGPGGTPLPAVIVRCSRSRTTRVPTDRERV